MFPETPGPLNTPPATDGTNVTWEELLTQYGELNPVKAVLGTALNRTCTSSVEGVHGELEIVQRKVYAVPAVPLKVDVGEEGVPNDPPEPLTTDQAPVPTEAVLAAKVTVVNPQVPAPV